MRQKLLHFLKVFQIFLGFLALDLLLLIFHQFLSKLLWPINIPILQKKLLDAIRIWNSKHVPPVSDANPNSSVCGGFKMDVFIKFSLPETNQGAETQMSCFKIPSKVQSSVRNFSESLVLILGYFSSLFSRETKQIKIILGFNSVLADFEMSQFILTSPIVLAQLYLSF